MTVKQQQSRISAAHRLRWRPLDIAVGAGLGAVSGLIYWLASLLASWIFPLMTALLPGAAALLHGVFYFPCTLSLLILRKPGAAVYVGVISVLVEILPGNAYNVPMILVEAIVEALCAELAFGIFPLPPVDPGNDRFGGYSDSFGVQRFSPGLLLSGGLPPQPEGDYRHHL